jgi:hypothetical protein
LKKLKNRLFLKKKKADSFEKVWSESEKEIKNAQNVDQQATNG